MFLISWRETTKQEYHWMFILNTILLGSLAGVRFTLSGTHAHTYGRNADPRPVPKGSFNPE
jgi:hypothetical protein